MCTPYARTHWGGFMLVYYTALRSVDFVALFPLPVVFVVEKNGCLMFCWFFGRLWSDQFAELISRCVSFGLCLRVSFFVHHSEPLLFARRHSTPSSPWEGGRTEGSWKIFMIIVCCSRCAALCLNGGKSVGFRQTNAEMQFCYVKVGSFLNIFIIATEFRLHFCLCKRFHVEFLNV